MDNKPKIEEAKPLLVISANEDYAALEASEPDKLIEAIYEALCAEKATLPTMCIMMAVEKFRVLKPVKYRAYIKSIYHALDEVRKQRRSKQDDNNSNPSE